MECPEWAQCRRPRWQGCGRGTWTQTLQALEKGSEREFLNQTGKEIWRQVEWRLGKLLGTHVGCEDWGIGTKPGKKAERQLGWEGERLGGRKTPGWGKGKGKGLRLQS
jgi:hypothetical protein